MKILTLAAAGAALALSTHVQADTVLGIDVGIGLWQADFSGDLGENRVDTDELGIKDEDNNFYFVALEHPIPLIPNIKLQYTDINTKDTGTLTKSYTVNGTTYTAGTNVTTDLDLSHTDAVLYYEVLDNWINLDLGMTLRYFDGQVKATDGTSVETITLEGTLPMAYGKAQFDLPFSGWSIAADAHFTRWKDDKLTDYSAKIMYNTDILPLLDLGLELGYREMKLEVEDLDDLRTDVTLDGPYIAATLHF
jgi:outer membrane protein